MAARPDGPVVAFDVSADGDEAGRPPGGEPRPPDRPEWWTRAAAWWRAASRRRRRAAVVAVGGALLAVAGASVVGLQVAEQVRADRLRAAPGGVVSLHGDLGEAWSTEASAVVAVLADGGLAFVDGEDVVVRDVADGTERWRADLGPEPECGPRPRLSSGVEWTLTTDLVTCLHGTAGARTVTVLDATGAQVGERTLDPQPSPEAGVFVAPAAAGGLAVVEHEIDLPEPRTVENSSAPRVVAGIDPEGLGPATLRVEDALTGAVRAESTAERWPQSLQDCVVLTADAAGRPRPATTRIELKGVREPIATPAVVGYQMCQGGTGMATDGTPLGVTDVAGVAFADLPSGELVEPFPGGGFVVSRRLAGAGLVADDGAGPALDPDSRVQAPATQVGTVDPAVIATRGSTVVGLASDGETRWETELEGRARVLARAAGVTVVSTDVSTDLVALDDGDGAERWRIDMVHPAPDGRWVWPTSAVTDGERVTVALMEGIDAGPTWPGSLLTVDLTSGDAHRTGLDLDGLPWVTAVDGHLLLHEVRQGGPFFRAWPEIISVRVLEQR
ncbi:PQQ-binding-like beta-propeller repeat protein [Isoptericola sp. b515]|uniref:outer membrane protein assembly factor BamB family protein n=1 Tax=Isoptericola sp. b515 TaxID=3064652 RepID=UPI00271383D7|nr:PQQ-binding-like beta-propeller repeat protein [Isoptericola sp. b515]MDO8147860.1 PQQ-binding-like beta-propeller repeat protein [Isoptericola sp. b515]